jgi:hypothetical protein
MYFGTWPLQGGVAEWLGGGLQNLIRRFKSVLTPLIRSSSKRLK